MQWAFHTSTAARALKKLRLYNFRSDAEGSFLERINCAVMGDRGSS